MSENEQEIELPALQYAQSDWEYAAEAQKQAIETQATRKENITGSTLYGAWASVACRERQLLASLQRISYLEAELQTVLDRAERYMDLCGEKDREIAQLKSDSQNACASDFCHHTETAHCNLTKEGMRGCCFCLCKNFILEDNDENP